MDLSGSLGKAQAAARRGDIDGLEIELARLRSLPSVARDVHARLRAMARSVRSHPSFSSVPNAQAV